MKEELLIFAAVPFPRCFVCIPICQRSHQRAKSQTRLSSPERSRGSRLKFYFDCKIRHKKEVHEIVSCTSKGISKGSKGFYKQSFWGCHTFSICDRNSSLNFNARFIAPFSAHFFTFSFKYGVLLIAALIVPGGKSIPC